MKNQTLAVLTLFVAAAQAPVRSQPSTFAGQPAEVISNGKVRLTLTTLGATLASIVLSDNPAKLNPLWDPVRIAREQGREVAFKAPPATSSASTVSDPRLRTSVRRGCRCTARRT